MSFSTIWAKLNVYFFQKITSRKKIQFVKNANISGNVSYFTTKKKKLEKN